jgi:autotransporter translocation and assembly factor TamB
MPLTPDRRPGEAIEEGLVFENRTPGSDPPLSGGLRYVDGAFRFHDAHGVFDPRTVGTGSASPAGSNTQIQFNDSGSFGGDARLVFDKATGAFNVHTLGVSGSTTTVSGTVQFEGNTLEIDANLFEITGTISATSMIVPKIGSSGSTTTISGTVQFQGDNVEINSNYLEVSGTISVTAGISGSLTRLSNGTSYLIAGRNVAVASGSNGAVTISSTGNVAVIEYEIGTSTVSSTTQVPSGATVLSVALQVTSVYSGGTSISVGYSGDSTAVMSSVDNTPTSTGIYKIDPVMGVVWGDSPAPLLTTIDGSPATGSGRVRVLYSMVNT